VGEIPVIIYRVGDRRENACIRSGERGEIHVWGGGYRNEKPFFLWTFINLMLDFIVTMWNRGVKLICDVLTTVNQASSLYQNL
jgi:hypothetical protein